MTHVFIQQYAGYIHVSVFYLGTKFASIIRDATS